MNYGRKKKPGTQDAWSSAESAFTVQLVIILSRQ